MLAQLIVVAEHNDTSMGQLAQLIRVARQNEMHWLAAWERVLNAQSQDEQEQAERDVDALAHAGAVMRERMVHLRTQAGL